MGDVREIASTAGTAQQQCYTYDGLDRLTAAYTATAAAVPASIVANCGSAVANHTGGTSPYDLNYTYDVMGLGNLTTTVDNMTTPATTSTYNYPSFNIATGLPVPGAAQPHTATGVVIQGPGVFLICPGSGGWQWRGGRLTYVEGVRASTAR